MPSRFDPRIFLLRPVYIEVNGTKAKIPDIGKDTFNVEYDIPSLRSWVLTTSRKPSLPRQSGRWGFDLDRGSENYRTFHDPVSEPIAKSTPLDGSWASRSRRDATKVAFRLVIAATETADTRLQVSGASGRVPARTKRISEGGRGIHLPTGDRRVAVSLEQRRSGATLVRDVLSAASAARARGCPKRRGGSGDPLARESVVAQVS